MALGQDQLPGLILHSKMENSCQFKDEIAGAPANGAMIDISFGPNKENTPNSATYFNNDNSYITLGAVSKLKLIGDRSISFSIKPVITGADRTGSIFTYGTGLVVGYQELGSVPKINISFGGTLYLQTNLTTQWQTVTITFAKDYSSNKSKASLYIDGIFKLESLQNKTAQTFLNSIAFIGPVNLATPVNGFRGMLDDLKLYDRALSATEILNAALPVKLESFTAKRVNGAVQINWKTSEEENVAFFNIQRSADGVLFSTITKIQPGKYNYQSFDANAPIDADTWYRLQIVDQDGKTEYSSVVRVLRDPSDLQSGIVMFPNPATAKLHFRGNIENHIIRIMTITGMLVKHQPLMNTINVSDISQGMYYIVIYDETGIKKMVAKFFKQNHQ